MREYFFLIEGVSNFGKDGERWKIIENCLACKIFLPDFFLSFFFDKFYRNIVEFRTGNV